MKVGFFGAPATHMPELLQDHADFLIKGEPEQAALRIAGGESPSGIMASPAINDLDTLPFPAWQFFDGCTACRRPIDRASRYSFPILSSRSCPEFCTYCPHRITAPYRARSAENVLDEIETPIGDMENLISFSVTLCLPKNVTGPSPLLKDPASRPEGKFECETRLDDLDKESIDLLHRAGLDTITFGVESMDPATLKRVGRRPIPQDHQRAIIEYCRDKRITTEGFMCLVF